ncbi:hypothetical protein Ga0080574_TMP2655 [Salipiger abyssi]|uniref:Uncharacterized protein n=1 Tax=Salipiger abyssi TaxID=1250539 RepID=A0A1P8UUB5_9RHOB|nr:hypothetical protein Ga0080574_TMP2655 [Salipiger abyssi]
MRLLLDLAQARHRIPACRGIQGLIRRMLSLAGRLTCREATCPQTPATEFLCVHELATAVTPSARFTADQAGITRPLVAIAGSMQRCRSAPSTRDHCARLWRPLWAVAMRMPCPACPAAMGENHPDAASETARREGPGAGNAAHR